MSRHLRPGTLYALAEDRAAGRKRAAAERHLERCATCRRRLSDVGTLLERLGELADAPRPRDDLWRDIERRVRASPPRAPAGPDPGPRAFAGGTGARRPVRGTRLLAPTVAAILVCIAGSGLWLAGRAGGPTSSEPTRAGASPESNASRVAAIERSYAPLLRRLGRLVDERSRLVDWDLAASAEEDLASFRASRREVRDALRAGPSDEALLSELEEGYRRELRYLERLASVAAP